jgi:hypothetical protein
MEYEKNVFSLYHNKTEGKNVFTGDQYTELMEHAAKIDTASTGASIEYLEEWYKAESREFEVNKTLLFISKIIFYVRL